MPPGYDWPVHWSCATIDLNRGIQRVLLRGGRWSGGIGSDFVVAPDVDEQARRQWLEQLHEAPRQEVVNNSGVLLDEAGEPVLNMYGEVVLFPLDFPPEPIMAEARAVRGYLENGNTVEIGFAKLGSDLTNFRQGGSWDAQRITGRFIWEHRDYSTILIGMYSCNAGLSEDEILTAQNIYARYKSSFSKYETMSNLYKFLPERNVRNTHIGYQIMKAR